MQQNEIAKQVLEILDVERAHILSGNFSKIEQIVATKSVCFDRLLGGQAPTPEFLELVRNKAKENQNLLASAVRAIRAVNGRIFALNNKQHPIETYSSAGTKIALGGNLATRFERRS